MPVSYTHLDVYKRQGEDISYIRPDPTASKIHFKTRGNKKPKQDCIMKYVESSLLSLVKTVTKMDYHKFSNCGKRWTLY